MKKKVQIHLRIKKSAESIWDASDNKLSYTLKNKTIEIESFDSLFIKEDNNQVYQRTVKEIVFEFKNQKSATIFAYGQTGSGKTHTIFGGVEDGLIKLALMDIFPDEMEISFIELFNEKVIDLSTGNELKIYQKFNEAHIFNLNWRSMSRFQDAVSFIETCMQNRKTGVTTFNSNSSRSHAILQIRRNNSILTFVDLAGSERACDDSKRMKEAAFINKSLLALGKLVNNLLNDKPYGFRDSKLTRILQNSITGNASIVAFCMISPSKSCVSESLNTLNFAARLSNLELKTINGVVKNDIKKEGTDFYKMQWSIEPELKKILTQRIEELEKMVLSLLDESPNQKISEIFVLERQMFNMKLKKISKDDL